MSLRWLLDLRPQGPLNSPPPHGLRPEPGSSDQRCPRPCPYLKLTSRVVSLLPYMDPVSLAEAPTGRLPRPLPGHQVRTGMLGQWAVRSHGQRDLGSLGTSRRSAGCSGRSSFSPASRVLLPSSLSPEPGTILGGHLSQLSAALWKHLPSWSLLPATCRLGAQWGIICVLTLFPSLSAPSLLTHLQLI